MGEFVSALILLQIPSKFQRATGCVSKGQAQQGSGRGLGGELQCSGMAVEDAKVQASDRRETMTYSQNVNSDLKCIHFCAEILARGARPSSSFVSAGCTAGQETQSLHPLIQFL